MDRKLLIHSKKGYLFAEFNFNYEQRNRATGNYTEYGHYQNDDGEYSVYPLGTRELYPDHRKYRSIDEIKQYDISVAKYHFSRELENMEEYVFSYDPEVMLSRYVLTTRREVIGVVNIRASFIENIKELEFISAVSLRNDEKLASDSLEGNYDLMMRVYEERVQYADVYRVAER